MNLESAVLFSTIRRASLTSIQAYGTPGHSGRRPGSGVQAPEQDTEDSLDDTNSIMEKLAKMPNGKELIQTFMKKLSPRWEAQRVTAGGVGSGRHSEGNLHPTNKPLHKALLTHGFSYKGTHNGESVYHHPQTGKVAVRQTGFSVTPEKELDEKISKRLAAAAGGKKECRLNKDRQKILSPRILKN